MLAGPAREGVGFVIAHMHDRRRRIDRLQARQRHRVPRAVDFAPVARRVPVLGLHLGPAVGQPQRRRRVAAVAHELEPLAVGDEMARDTHSCDQHLVPRRLVVEAEAVAVVADGWMPDGTRRSRRAPSWTWPRRRLPVGVVGRIGRVLREGVQDVGEQQLLMLLLVMQPDLEDRNTRLASPRGALDQPLDRAIDMGAIGRDLLAIRAGDQAALRARMTRTGGDVIGIEQEAEALVEFAIAGRAARAGTSRRTRWCARDAIWSGSRPASTARSGLRPTDARRALGLGAHGRKASNQRPRASSKDGLAASAPWPASSRGRGEAAGKRHGKAPAVMEKSSEVDLRNSTNNGCNCSHRHPDSATQNRPVRSR